jgi:hypothetical protein
MHAGCSPLCGIIVSCARSDAYFLVDTFPLLVVVEADCSSTQGQAMAHPHKKLMMQHRSYQLGGASRPAGVFEFQRANGGALGTLFNAGRVMSEGRRSLALHVC